MASLELQERRGCSLQAFGPVYDEVTIETLTANIGNFTGPDWNPEVQATGPEQGLVRFGQAQPDIERVSCPPHFERDRWADWTVLAMGVLATFNVPGNRATRPPNSFDPAVFTTCPAVKLRVSSPQWKGPVWIDCDCTIVLPSPRLCVDVMAPQGWVDGGSGGGPLEQAWNAWLFAKVCRGNNWPTALPRLTEYFTLAELEVRTFTRRRGARRVWISSQPFAQVWELLDPSIGVVGTIIIPANTFQAVDLFAGITQIRNTAIAPGATSVTLVWEVQP